MGVWKEAWIGIVTGLHSFASGGGCQTELDPIFTLRSEGVRLQAN
jgi:hypothetical protein